MPLFEVFIPTADPDGFNITARIRAESWIQALRAGLSRLGDTTDVRNVMCDITETGIDVTEPNSGRVFRIRELPEAAPPAAPAPGPAASPPAAVVHAPPPPAPVVKAAPPPAQRAITPPPAAPSPAVPTKAVPPTPGPAAAKIEAKPVPAPAPVVSVVTPAAAKPALPAAEKAATTTGRFRAELEDEQVTQEKAGVSPVQQIGRAKEKTRSVEDILGELFEATQGIYDHGDMREAARFVLDLAHRSIPSDSGAVFIADIDAQDLYFAAATGPKADAVMDFRVPMGKGIVGFAAQEGVSLAVSDVHKDPRFYAAISQALGYETRSILCAPAVQDGRTFAAIELINKKSGTSFTGDEVNVLNYLAHEFADYLISTGQTGV